MDAFSSADRSPRPRWLRRRAYQGSPFSPRVSLRLLCLSSALLLITLAGSTLLLWKDGLAHARAATGCPISNLPPPPTSGSPLDPSTIILNEILTNPGEDWNCDGKSRFNDQWIELRNTSNKDESLFGLQLESQGKVLLLNSSYLIAANSSLVLFSNQIPTILLAQGYGQLQLLDGAGNVVDAVAYPPLGTDQSYARDASGQWQITSTPTPGTANIITGGSSPSPTPTPTKRAGSGGGSGGSGGGGSGSKSTPTATPTPIGSVVLPSTTSIALQNPTDPASSGTGGNGNQGGPSWLKIALIAFIGTALLGVVIWYLRFWRQEPEGDDQVSCR